MTREHVLCFNQHTHNAVIFLLANSKTVLQTISNFKLGTRPCLVFVDKPSVMNTNSSPLCLFRDYLQALLGYLEQFYERTNPLGSLTKVYSKLEGDFDSAFEEGQVPGWEDRGVGKAPGDDGNAIDLQAFDTVDELESLGEHALVASAN